MKKLISILISSLLCISLVGCGGATNSSSSEDSLIIDTENETITQTIGVEGSTVQINDFSFENENSALISSSAKVVSTDAYYGNNSLSLSSNSSTSLELTLDYSLVSFNTLSAGIWVKIDEESNNEEVNLRIYAMVDGEYILVKDRVETASSGNWEYIKTNIEKEETAKGATQIKIELVNNKDKAVLFDFLQVGDSQAFNGNPEKLALMAYQPWYSDGLSGSAGTSGGSYGNWQYGSTNPSTTYSVDGVLRRDIASVYYPAIGTYSSTNREVIEYHLQLMKAMNVDVVQVNYYAGLRDDMIECFDLVVEVANEMGLKVSALYEHKIHFLDGWIDHDTRAESLAAVEQDILDFIEKYQDEPCILKIDGKVAIEMFGLAYLTQLEWAEIALSVSETVGYKPPLFGDNVGNSDYLAMTGMMNWSLYSTDLQTPTDSQVVEFVEKINSSTITWQNKKPGQNIGIGVIFPGFDDTAVNGWGDGARKIDMSLLDFYPLAYEGFSNVNQFDWIIVATFNDWNEGTIIEPSVEFGTELAKLTQQYLYEFKGEGNLAQDDIDTILNDYLENRTIEYI